MQDWSWLRSLHAAASPGPWVLQFEDSEAVVVDAEGFDITGVAPADSAANDFKLIADLQANLIQILDELERHQDLLLAHKVCLECGKRMNRQLYCVKCDLEWSST
jgi:hypothetical protein